MKVITAWAERHAGPGWANSLIWYIWKDEAGRLREDCFQPDEQTGEMRLLFGTACELHGQLRSAVKSALEGKGLA